MIPPVVAATGPPVNLDLPLGWSLALALFLVGLNGFFVAAEFALVKVRPTQVAPHQDTLRGRLAQRMIDQLDAYLSATQLGITLASIGLGIVGEPAVNRLLQPLFDLVPSLPAEAAHSISLMVAFAIISIFHIVLGELAPKSLAIRRPEPTSLWVAAPLWFFYQVTYPGIWVLNQMANAFLRLFGIEPLRHGELAHSEEEIRSLLASEQETELSEPKRELLDNVFELSDRNARQVMVPRHRGRLPRRRGPDGRQPRPRPPERPYALSRSARAISTSSSAWSTSRISSSPRNRLSRSATSPARRSRCPKPCRSTS